jgi:hypothetical protein
VEGAEVKLDHGKMRSDEGDLANKRAQRRDGWRKWDCDDRVYVGWWISDIVVRTNRMAEEGSGVCAK